MQVIDHVPSIAANEMARVYRLDTITPSHLIRCFVDGEAATFSFFARTVSSPVTLRVTLQSPYSSITQDFIITESWKRYELSTRNTISLSPLDVFAAPIDAASPSVDVALAFPQCEGGLFASSPIPPDTPLPAIADGPAAGATRAADQLWFDEKKDGILVDANSATIVLTVDLLPRTDQILKDDYFPIMSFVHSGSDSEISIGVSGQHDARFIVRSHSTAGDVDYISDVIAGADIYFIAISFDRGRLSVIINGSIVQSVTAETVQFDRLYLGSSPFWKSSMFGYLQRFIRYPAPLMYPKILQLYMELCPGKVHATYEYMLQYFRYAIADSNELNTLNECISDTGFSYFKSQLEFALPAIYEQFAPGKEFTEGNVRDWVMAHMRRPGVTVTRESYSEIGRTDISLNFSFLDEESQSSISRVFRMEFKIWGRRGYKECPSQPLKYMMEEERAAAVIMIDRRKVPNMDEFLEHVATNSEFKCLGIKEIPILDGDIKYFVSFHSDSRYRSPRMMINIYLHIPD